MRKKKILLLPLAVFSTVLCLSGCQKSDDTIVLRILNMEDYIYVNDPKQGYDLPNIYDETFTNYVRENYPEFDKYNIQVVYDTTDTNESLYSELQTGKSFYDLICPSDYMIQKLLSNDMLVKLDKELIPNYFGDGENNGYASQYIKGTLDNITSKSYKNQTEYIVGDYSVGYMWGTLGLLFNPSYSMFDDSDSVINDMQYWSSLWESKYKGTFSIKDSMRDTYAVGIMETYKDELYDLKDKHDQGTLDDVTYNIALSDIFNRCEDKYAKEVQPTLESLKANAFGLEVDSGKQDIVTKKIGLNIAWSGDAVYSMDQAEDEEQVSEPFELCYAIPETGSNIWFDAWVMPSTSRSEQQRLLAHAFLNFLSEPMYAAMNMDYTGYTSFIGGDDILDLVRDWYDYRTDEIYYSNIEEEIEYASIFYEDPQEKEIKEVWYQDCHFLADNDPNYDNVQLYYGTCDYKYDDEGNLLYLTNVYDGNKLKLSDLSPIEDEGESTYNDRLIIPDDIEEVDLTYFFALTLDEYEEEDMIFYSDCYLPYTVIDEEGEEKQNVCVGRQFFCQYPDLNTITRCAVMKDYRENNQSIMTMWEEFKSNSLPLWAIILFISEGVVIAGCLIFYFVNKQRKKLLRKRR